MSAALSVVHLLAPALGVVVGPRHEPAPAGWAGLAVSLLALAVLASHQLRASWRERTGPGPVPSRRPAADRDGLAFSWSVSVVLVLVVAVVFVERLVALT